MLDRAAPHSDLVKVKDALQRVKMRFGLHAAAEQRQHPAAGAGEIFGCRSRDRCRAHLGNQPSVQNHQWLAGVGAEQQDHRVMRRHAMASISGVEADELGAHCVLGNRRHDPEIAAVLLDRQHFAHRPDDASARERDQRHLHCRDQRIPAEQMADFILAEILEH